MKNRKIVAYGLVIAALLFGCDTGCRSERRGNSTSEVSEQPRSQSSQVADEASPLTWSDVASSYAQVIDYVCLYEKEESAISKGELQTIRLFFRKPFDVRLDWLNDSGRVDQTAVYRQGLNNGKVLARQSGLLGALAGKVQLDPNESLAKADSRHPITEVGFGKIIERTQRDATNPGIASRFGGEEALDGRPAYKFEFTSKGTEDVGELANARKALIWIDRELKLPAKFELYDGANTLLERHRFKNVRVNQKLSDKTFTL